MFFKPIFDRRSLEVRNSEIENENFIVKEVSVSQVTSVTTRLGTFNLIKTNCKIFQWKKM